MIDLGRCKHIFFDLDGTLWDFERNSDATMQQLWHQYIEPICNASYDDFMKKYHIRNEQLWDAYAVGKVNKEQVHYDRFIYTLYDINIHNMPLAYQLGDAYVASARKGKYLYEGTHEVLTYLKQYYTLHIISNGFSESQYEKLAATQLRPYFETITLSDNAGALKPSPLIYKYALQVANTSIKESVYIGDNYIADVMGAINAGWIAIRASYKKYSNEIEYIQDDIGSYISIKTLYQLILLFAK